MAEDASLARYLPEVTEEERELVARFEARRLALSGDQETLRSRYEEVMRWANPPWDPSSMRVDPRPEYATARRSGENVFHADFVNPVIDRWASLQVGVPPTLRVRPTYVSPPVDSQQQADPEQYARDKRKYDVDRAIVQNEANQIEAQTNEWIAANDFHRTLLWAVWAKEAFGKAIIKSGYDLDSRLPTCEVLENPSQCYYGWSQRYGRRKLAWAMVAEELDPIEAEFRFGVILPRDESGKLDLSTWTGALDQGDMDQRAEQEAEVQRYVWVEETWELAENPDTGRIEARYALVLAGRIIDGPTFYPWSKLPIHILESQHIPTYANGKSVGEVAISINEALDDLWDKQKRILRWASGPRFKGLNMGNKSDDVDLPDAFHLLPLTEGEDIAQIEARIDLWPSQVHADQLYEALHRATGLTPIAWGMSPNAQTSGRAMAAEWRAVELPLHGRLINLTPVLKEIWSCWWDYAEAYDPEYAAIGKGIRRFDVLWAPFDIRDRTEKTLDIVQQWNSNLIDPETALQELGRENTDEMMARIESWMLNPVWNPLRYQQYLTLQQLSLAIQQQALELQAMQGQVQGGQQQAQQAQAQGNNAALQQAQGPAGPQTPAQNQPGQTPGPGGLPVETSILSQTPLQGGIGNRAIVPLGGGSPTAGTAPR